MSVTSLMFLFFRILVKLYLTPPETSNYTEIRVVPVHPHELSKSTITSQNLVTLGLSHSFERFYSVQKFKSENLNGQLAQ